MTVWIENPFDNLPVEGFRAQRYWMMAEAFAAAGDEVTLWTSDFNHTTKSGRVISAWPEKFSLRLIPTLPYHRNVSLARIRSHRAYAAVWSRMIKREKAPDLVIVSLPTLSTASVALSLKRRYGTRVVVDIMDDWPGTFRRLFPSVLRPLAGILLAPFSRIARQAVRKANLVTGVADAYEALAKRYGARFYRRFYHGIELPARLVDANRVPGRIVYAGNLGRSYDLETAIRAVAADISLSLDIAGCGEGEDRLRALAEDLRVADRVRFHGYLDRDALYALMARSSCGLVPMAPETCVGVPYKLADYAAMGLPVVSSLGGESAALLRRYRCGEAYEPGDVESLLTALRTVRGDSRAMAEAEFDSAVLYRNYVTYIRDTLFGIIEGL